MIKVLYAAAEAAPFIKTGGLADVMGALPREMQAQGVEACLVIPKYGQIKDEYKAKMEKVYEGTVDLSWRRQYFGVEKLVLDGVTVYFIDNERYFKRNLPYGYDDDAERFAFFSKAVLAMLPHIDFKPELIHCNDWHTGMLGCYLKESFYQDSFYWGMKVVYTVHNLKYQGIFGRHIVGDVLGLPDYLFNNGQIENNGCVNFMKSGLVYADYITTVSPSYAQEITTPYFGERLEGYLRVCQNKLRGIINGLDEKAYSPATDSLIPNKYTVDNAVAAKAANKEALQKELGLPVNRNVPMVAMITRLVEDKGLDLFTCIMDELMNENLQLVIIGTGDRQYEDALKGLAWRNPAKVSVQLVFNEGLAHKLYAGADIFVMPSRFEACGLSQLIALKYGTIPVVREVGGLRDTVVPYDKYKRTGNGISFANFNAHELLFSIKSALSFYEDKAIWKSLILNAMTSDYSWEKSAKAYADIYKALVGLQPEVESKEAAKPEKQTVAKPEAAKAEPKTTTAGKGNRSTAKAAKAAAGSKPETAKPTAKAAKPKGK